MTRYGLLAMTVPYSLGGSAPDFTVAYGPLPEQIADIRLPPPGSAPKPLVIFIHGGFWMAEWDRAHAAPLAAGLAADGYPVASLEFRRVGMPGGGWPGTFDDVAAVSQRWSTARSTRSRGRDGTFGRRPSRYVGDSASSG